MLTLPVSQTHQMRIKRNDGVGQYPTYRPTSVFMAYNIFSFEIYVSMHKPNSHIILAFVEKKTTIWIIGAFRRRAMYFFGSFKMIRIFRDQSIKINMTAIYLLAFRETFKGMNMFQWALNNRSDH